MTARIFLPELWPVTCTEENYRLSTTSVNCYAYVLNNPNYYWAVPGLGFVKAEAQQFFDSFNHFFAGFSPADFRAFILRGAVEDGLEPIEAPVQRLGYYLAALVFPENDYDFHWYRQDMDGLWSHKNGWMPPTNLDANQRLIVNPQLACRQEYSLWGSYFLVPEGGVVLGKSFPLLSRP